MKRSDMPAGGGDIGADSRPQGLELSEVGKSFGGVAAVRDCTVTVRLGRVTGIVGPNGAGKSTLFNLISGFVVPDKGKILYRGEDLVGLSPEQVFKRGIARSFQGVRTLKNLTVTENLLLATTAAGALSSILHPRLARRDDRRAMERARKVLEELDLAKAGNRRAGELGYAEQKLLSIARLMMTDVETLLLDEPFGGLDAGAVDEFVGRIRDLVARHGRTVCVVEHNLNAIRRVADDVIFMAEGTVQAAGSAAEILGREDLARVYLGTGAGQGAAT